MRVELKIATLEQSAAIAALRAAVADNLTRKHGHGHWSSGSSERGVLSDIRNSHLYVASHRNKLIASLRLETKKPWAIDLKYFSACRQPLYLLSMAVHPDWQRQGVGRLCIEEVKRIARAWPADAIMLDAYDASAGAGEFIPSAASAKPGA